MGKELPNLRKDTTEELHRGYGSVPLRMDVGGEIGEDSIRKLLSTLVKDAIYVISTGKRPVTSGHGWRISSDGCRKKELRWFTGETEGILDFALVCDFLGIARKSAIAKAKALYKENKGKGGKKRAEP